MILLWAGVAAGLGGCSGAAVAPGSGASTRAWFEADLLTGYDDSGNPTATLTVSLPYRRLVFRRVEDGYESRYRIRAIQRRGKQALRLREWPGIVHVADYEQTRQQKMVRRTVTLDLADTPTATEDPLWVEVQVEVEGTHRQGRRFLRVRRGPAVRGGLALGELALYRLRDPFASPANDLEVLARALPDPALFVRAEQSDFDLATGEPWLFVRIFDLREGATEASFPLQVEVLDAEGSGPRWSRTITAARLGTETEVLVKLPAEAFDFGPHRIRVRLPGADPAETRLDDRGLDLADDESWKANLRRMEVLGPREEIEAMRHAPVPERASLWEAYWRARDPDPQTAENEALEQFFRRVSYARRHFADGFRDGSLSDRGRVWILHGRPDRVETTSPAYDAFVVYEVWTYEDARIVYYFQDRDGLGNWRLVWQERF